MELESVWSRLGIRGDEVGERAAFEPLPGLTNLNYKVVTGDEAFVLRLPGAGTAAYINRGGERHNAQLAAVAGVNVDVAYFDAFNGTMVTRYVEGQPLTAGHFHRDPAVPARAARLLKQVHSLRQDFKGRFDIHRTIQEYERTLRASGRRAGGRYEAARPRIEAILEALSRQAVRLVPSHNDPWPGNFLDTGTGLHLLDWEYSTMNDPMWDLADLSVEASFGVEQDWSLLSAYHGGTPPLAAHARMALYKALSDYLWSLWALVQQVNGNPAEDFEAYARRRLEGCWAALDDMELVHHLRALGQAA